MTSTNEIKQLRYFENESRCAIALFHIFLIHAIQKSWWKYEVNSLKKNNKISGKLDYLQYEYDWIEALYVSFNEVAKTGFLHKNIILNRRLRESE